MTDRPASDPANKWVDPERPRATKPFDQPNGQFGQQYDLRHERAEGAGQPSGTVNPHRAATPAPQAGKDIPAENGRRASFDPRTGEVHGSGVGTGGGAPGEDFDGDSMAGSGYPLTGTEQESDKTPGDRGPPRLKE